MTLIEKIFRTLVIQMKSFRFIRITHQQSGEVLEIHTHPERDTMIIKATDDYLIERVNYEKEL